MNKAIVLFLLLTIALLTSCLHHHLSIDGLPVIDVSRKYAEKEIILSNIAEITYVCLDSKRNDFLYKGTIQYITKNTIVVKCAVTHSILFFSKDGAPKSRFNRYGNGPEEYWGTVNQIVYDEAADDVFISIPFINYIQVYSSKGEYKRKLPLPHGVALSQMGSFDHQSLIIYDDSRRLYKAQPKTSKDNMNYLKQKMDSSFFLVSKADGQVLDYIPMNISQKDLSFKTPDGMPALLPLMNMVKHTEGFLLCNPETDTVFLYNKNKEFIPIICKIPLIDKSEPKIIINNCMDIDQYQFIEVQIVGWEYGNRKGNKHYIRDKKTGEVFQQKIVLPEYKGKTITISPDYSNFFYENGTIFSLDLYDLKQAYKDNRLRGKLKELVATLNENRDNDVFMLVDFKKTR